MSESDESALSALDRSQLELEQTMSQSNNNRGGINLSPVQIQQEYFENLPECDWVK